MLNKIKDMFKFFTVSEDFRGDWYGYACNQLSHAFLGFLTVCLVSMWGYMYFGQFMPKEMLWGIVAGGYLIFEWKSQGLKSPLDTLEDWVFFSVYGAGGPVLLFSEQEKGSPVLETSVLYMGPIVSIMVAHIFAGVVVRLFQKVKADNKKGVSQ